jgi:hypothetical protein
MRLKPGPVPNEFDRKSQGGRLRAEMVENVER